MDLFENNIEKGLRIAKKVDKKYKPVFDGLPPEKSSALALYFLPHNSKKEVVGVTRPRVIKWYCPFADQRDFPSGHRYCINVYTGCSHKCQYCYAQGYEPDEVKCKDNFRNKLLKDLVDIKEFNLPPAPVHLSNSTDPLQPIEQQLKLTLYTLQQLVRYRKYFISIVILTKNPSILIQPQYLDVLKELIKFSHDHPGRDFFEENNLRALRVEASLAFYDQADADFYDPGAPSISDRMKAIEQLRENDISVVMRIDPLLPRDHLPNGKSLKNFNLPDSQNLNNLEKLVKFAAEHKCLHIAYSVAKIVSPRYKSMPGPMLQLKKVYENMVNHKKLVFRGGSWRLPDEVAEEYIVEPFKEICNKHEMKAYFCKQNLLLTY